eukprot:jgi/Chlat1/4631/Chrsp3S05585
MGVAAAGPVREGGPGLAAALRDACPARYAAAAEWLGALLTPAAAPRQQQGEVEPAAALLTHVAAACAAGGGSTAPPSLLTDQQLSDFEQLEAQGKVLRGAELEAAISRQARTASSGSRVGGVGDDSDDDDDDDIRELVSRAREEAAALRMRTRTVLAARCQGVASCREAMAADRLRRSAALANARRDLRVTQERALRRDSAFADLLDRLVTATHDMARMLGSAGAQSGVVGCDLSAYAARDTDCTRELHRRHLASAAAIMDGGTEVACAAPAGEDRQGGARAAREREEHELTRLVSIWEVSLAQHVDAKVSLAKERARLDLLRTDCHPQHRLSAEGVEERLERVRAETRALHTQVLPILFREVARLQRVHALLGEYRRVETTQRARQSEQQQLEEQLAAQAARNGLLAAACSADTRRLHHAAHLLTDTRNALAELAANNAARSELYKDLRERAERGVQRSRGGSRGKADAFLLRLHRIVNDSGSDDGRESPNEYVSARVLAQQCASAREEAHRLAGVLRTDVPEERRCAHQQLLERVRATAALLGVSPSERHHTNHQQQKLRLLPQALGEDDIMVAVESAREALGARVDGLTKDLAQKRRLHQHEGEGQLERRAWTLLLNRPEDLARRVADLAQRAGR